MSSEAIRRKLEALRQRPVLPYGNGHTPRGRLLVVGGHEDREDEQVVLRLLARRVGSGKLVVATVASSSPDEMWEVYEPVFRALGVPHVHHLRIESREDADSVRSLRTLEDASAVYFAGGDQLRITTLVGDTPTYSRIAEIFCDGGTIAGTSAGASVMSETMIVGGGADQSFRIGSELQLAPGFGFAKDMVIDQHFAERGRIARLLGVVAQNPRILGIGIDEDTAIEIEPERELHVVGAGSVYVIDGRHVSHTNVAEEDRDRSLSVFGARLHVLSQGDSFDLMTRTPTDRPASEVEVLLGMDEPSRRRG